MPKPTLHAIATALESLAAHFRTVEDFEIDAPMLHFGSCYEKQQFLNLAAALPRPLLKGNGILGDGKEISLEYRSDAITIYARAPRSLVCREVTPARAAVYECEPLLSQLEERSLTEDR